MLGSGTQKQRADLLSSSAASFTKTKARLSTPWAGLDNCLPKRLKSEYVFLLLQHPSLIIFFTVYTLYKHMKTWNNQCRTFPFHFQKAHCIPSLLLWTVSTPTQVHIDTAVTYDSADVRVDQKIGRQMLWANLAAPDCAKATRHSKALNTGSDGSNCWNGIILWNSFMTAAWQN